MFGILAIAASMTATWFGYTQARNFMRERLRFVTAAQSFWAPLIAGAGAALLATPVVALLPIIGSSTAIAFGISVALGVANGQRDIRRNLPSGF